MTQVSDIAHDQLADGLERQLRAWKRLDQESNSAAASLLTQLRGSNKKKRSAAVEVVLTVLWGQGAPYPEWWSTPVGRLCAVSLSEYAVEDVPVAAAAARLGVSRQRIHALLNEGKLERGAEAGVTERSVFKRLGAML